MPEKPRQRGHVNWLGKRHPDAWARAEARRREGRGGWPAWCHLPMEAWWEIARRDWPGGKATPEGVVNCCRLAALGAWRVTQGVYRFDPDLYAALVTTPLAGELPDALLQRLPAWGVYLETPGLAFDGRALLGVYAHLDHARDGRTELRLVLDSESDYRLLPVPVRLGHGSLQAAVEATSAAAREKMERFAPQRRAAFAGGAERDAGDARDLAPVVSLLLYLCADEADYGRPPQGAPRPCGRARAPEAVRCWAVGERVGAALRGESNAAGPPGPGSGERAGPRPHWRRAHWHTFWAGPRDGERAVRVKWLPPVPVNVGAPDALPVTVRPVRGAGGTPPERGDA